MNCPNCGGAGCAQCQKPGMGMGKGRGMGERPTEETDTGFFDTKASTKSGKGVADIVDKVEGPNLPGQVQTQITKQEEAMRAAPADPLTDQNLPRKHKESVTDYFNRMREGN
jgi:hypothetical protein